MFSKSKEPNWISYLSLSIALLLLALSDFLTQELGCFNHGLLVGVLLILVIMLLIRDIGRWRFLNGKNKKSIDEDTEQEG